MILLYNMSILISSITSIIITTTFTTTTIIVISIDIIIIVIMFTISALLLLLLLFVVRRGDLGGARLQPPHGDHAARQAEEGNETSTTTTTTNTTTTTTTTTTATTTTTTTTICVFMYITIHTLTYGHIREGLRPQRQRAVDLRHGAAPGAPAGVDAPLPEAADALLRRALLLQVQGLLLAPPGDLPGAAPGREGAAGAALPRLRRAHAAQRGLPKDHLRLRPSLGVGRRREQRRHLLRRRQRGGRGGAEYISYYSLV